jgi:hypothetical protein
MTVMKARYFHDGHDLPVKIPTARTITPPTII